jgi:hypothetical protein
MMAQLFAFLFLTLFCALAWHNPPERKAIQPNEVETNNEKGLHRTR